MLLALESFFLVGRSNVVRRPPIPSCCNDDALLLSTTGENHNERRYCAVSTVS